MSFGFGSITPSIQVFRSYSGVVAYSYTDVPNVPTDIKTFDVTGLLPDDKVLIFQYIRWTIASANSSISAVVTRPGSTGLAGSIVEKNNILNQTGADVVCQACCVDSPNATGTVTYKISAYSNTGIEDIPAGVIQWIVLKGS